RSAPAKAKPTPLVRPGSQLEGRIGRSLPHRCSMRPRATPPASPAGRVAGKGRPEGVGTGLDTGLEVHGLTRPRGPVSHPMGAVMVALGYLFPGDHSVPRRVDTAVSVAHPTSYRPPII